MTKLLSPETTHVGDTLDGETVIAYTWFKDDPEDIAIQSVITLIPKERRKPYPDVRGGNYRTFFLYEDGTQHHSKCHWNIVEATERYADEMGGDI